MTTCGKTLLTAAIAMAAYAGTADAALIYEPFEDDNSTLNGNTSGVGLTTNWSAGGSWDVQSGSYSFGSLATSGNRAEVDGGRSGASANLGTTLSDAGVMADGQTLWFSTLLLTYNGSSGNADFGLAIGTNGLGGSNNIPMGGDGQGIGLTVKNNQIQATTWNLGPGDTNDDAERSGGLSISPDGFGEVFLVVGEIIWGDGTDDTINLYAPDEDLNLGAIVSTQSRDLNQANFDLLTFANKADNLPLGFDEIRFGRSAAEVLPSATVIPSPSAALIGVLGLGGIAFRRRRG